MTVASGPSVTRVYQNHHLDSTRWDAYAPRPGDIVITTSYKSGTTWTQQILQNLILGAEGASRDLLEVSPWVDARFIPIPRSELEGVLEGLPSPRFLKSHLPLDGLPFYPDVRYLIVGRDPRDVFMSFFNHYSSYTDFALENLFAGEDVVGPPLPRCPEDPRALWPDWIGRGWFEWESEGWPFWSNLHHTRTYWEWRHLPNLHFVHYNDMLEDLEGKVREIAEFCALDVSEEEIERTVEATTFANVRKRVEEKAEADDRSSFIFKGGDRTFFFKGKNGRWRDVLTEEDLALYEQAMERVLEPECATWLERGGPIANS
jgi:aryl sulfotransferase